MTTTKHYLDHEQGSMELMQGENWFDMIHGVFEKQSDCFCGYTGIIFYVVGSHVQVRNISPDTELSMWQGGNSNDDDEEENYAPSGGLLLLCPGDKFRIDIEKFETMIQKSITFTYRRSEPEE